MMKKGRTTFSFMHFVFDDILFKFLITVASCSLRDLFSVKMVSKKLSTRLDYEARLTKSQTSSIPASNCATSRPFTWWGCDTSSETIIKKTELSSLRVQSLRSTN
ncbi:hypothetical protein D8674_026227 [Pyrus ussuriensis x Pyrus communis]|uniref:Uncharacterized protein n=1 Tax=Pyrus ussuriensis x Pyrus communis TaxID=2448454 RepID=A0A5N5I9C9_9ROSA|nr:hypothetical protein D8674_026227 [Pyrus ussuriensis x Pyrus communis]